MAIHSLPPDSIQHPNLLSGNSSVSNIDNRHVSADTLSSDASSAGSGREADSSLPLWKSQSLDGSLRKQEHEGIPKTTLLKPNVSANRRKRVSWDRIHTREFVLVVGDHPMCQDGLPVSLGWQYNDNSCSTKSMNLKSGTISQENQQTHLSERRQSYVFPRRLSYEERRDKLVSVSNLTLDQIKNDEIDLVVRTLKESWDSERIQEDENVVMERVDGYGGNLDFLMDDNLMELEDIDMVAGIENDITDIDLEDLGDITDFQWR